MTCQVHNNITEKKGLFSLKNIISTRIAYKESEPNTQGLYICVKTNSGRLKWFETSSAVRQGSVLSFV